MSEPTDEARGLARELICIYFGVRPEIITPLTCDPLVPCIMRHREQWGADAERYRKALEPFAEYGKILRAASFDGELLTVSNVAQGMFLRAKHFFNALALSAPAAPEPEYSRGEVLKRHVPADKEKGDG